MNGARSAKISAITGTVCKVRRELKNCVQTERLHGAIGALGAAQYTAASSHWNAHSIFSRLGLPLTNLSITWLLSVGNHQLHLNDSC